jgi:hypothetical protein
MLDDQARRGPGLSGITRDSGQRLTTGVRRRAETGRTPGSVLIAVAAWLLALTGGGALFVSFTAQYTYIRTVRGEHRSYRRLTRVLHQLGIPARASRLAAWRECHLPGPWDQGVATT